MRNIVTIRRLAVRGIDHADWYNHGQQSINLWSYQNSADPHVVTDVLAITSPRVSVSRNIRLTKHFIRHGELPSGVLPATVRALEKWRDSGRIDGQKTSAFAAALRGDTSAIVRDTWIAKAFGVEQEKIHTREVRTYIDNLISRLGRELGLSPRDAQAAIWAGCYLETFREANVPRLTL